MAVAAVDHDLGGGDVATTTVPGDRGLGSKSTLLSIIIAPPALLAASLGS